ncbi:MAG: hypothetical protein ACEY26_00530 [Candidatus Hodgkinia cicadicola]
MENFAKVKCYNELYNVCLKWQTKGNGKRWTWLKFNTIDMWNELLTNLSATCLRFRRGTNGKRIISF